MNTFVITRTISLVKRLKMLKLALNNNITDVRYAVVESFGRAGVALGRDPLRLKFLLEEFMVAESLGRAGVALSKVPLLTGYKLNEFIKKITEALARSLEEKK